MIENDILRWLVGLVAVAIIVGTIVSYLWYALLCWLLNSERKVPAWPKRPLEETGQLTGIVERVFFTVAIATGMSGTAIAMIAWITVKNLILWPGFTRNGPSAQGSVSLLTSVGSMLVAIVGAQICNGSLL
jgi:hypothetical protein